MRVSGFSARVAAARPDSRPPPPSGATIADDVGQIFENLESGGGVARDEAVVVERVDEVSGHPVGRVRLDRFPALVVGGADDRRAEPLDRANLRVGRGVHHHHRAARPGLARGERYALGRVAGADRPDAVAQLRRRELADDVVGAANLEGADRLQRLELQVQLEPSGPRDRRQLDANQRRADGGVVDRAGSVADRASVIRRVEISVNDKSSGS